MKLIYPLENFKITQQFGANANESYEADGLKGHTAMDLVSTFDAPIHAAITGEVYAIQNRDNPDPMKYRAVYQIYDDIDYSYEVSYGHCNHILAKEGEIAVQGTQLATEGNTGTCYVGQHLVTREEKLAGSTSGFHTHFQVRKCLRVTKRDPKKHYLENSEGKVKRNGFYYEIVDYDNGYNGCIDPTPFLAPKYIFTRPLKKGMEGEDVTQLQMRLKEESFFDKPYFTDFFGDVTFAGVKKYQSKYKDEILTPAGLWFPTGYVGEFTLRKLNQ